MKAFFYAIAYRMAAGGRFSVLPGIRKEPPVAVCCRLAGNADKAVR